MVNERVGDSIRFHRYPLAGIDAMAACTTRSFPRHTHDQFGIGIVDEGGHASWSGKGQVEAAPGQFICVNPGEVHDGRAVGGRPRAWRILYLDVAVMDDLRRDVTDGGAASFEFASPVFDNARLRGAFEAAFAHAHRAAAPAASETALLTLVARLQVHSRAVLSFM
jgi:hypothetical protein